VRAANDAGAISALLHSVAFRRLGVRRVFPRGHLAHVGAAEGEGACFSRWRNQMCRSPSLTGVPTSTNVSAKVLRSVAGKLALLQELLLVPKDALHLGDGPAPIGPGEDEPRLAPAQFDHVASELVSFLISVSLTLPPSRVSASVTSRFTNRSAR
jgi:hypothetical protein